MAHRRAVPSTISQPFAVDGSPVGVQDFHVEVGVVRSEPCGTPLRHCPRLVRSVSERVLVHVKETNVPGAVAWINEATSKPSTLKDRSTDGLRRLHRWSSRHVARAAPA